MDSGTTIYNLESLMFRKNFVLFGFLHENQSYSFHLFFKQWDVLVSVGQGWSTSYRLVAFKENRCRSWSSLLLDLQLDLIVDGVRTMLLMLSGWRFTRDHLHFHRAWQKQLLLLLRLRLTLAKVSVTLHR